MPFHPDHVSTASHQTARLTRGSHRSPDDGVCVMELASMLAGEDFGDHPDSVCPVIGGFLRTYNDSVDDDRRQDLYRYAAEVVGTRSSRQVRLARARLCRRLTAAGRRSWPLLSGRFSSERAATRAALTAADPTAGPGHAAALAFVDELIAVGAEERRDEPSLPTKGIGSGAEAARL